MAKRKENKCFTSLSLSAINSCFQINPFDRFVHASLSSSGVNEWLCIIISGEYNVSSGRLDNSRIYQHRNEQTSNDGCLWFHQNESFQKSAVVQVQGTAATHQRWEWNKYQHVEVVNCTHDISINAQKIVQLWNSRERLEMKQKLIFDTEDQSVIVAMQSGRILKHRTIGGADCLIAFRLVRWTQPAINSNQCEICESVVPWSLFACIISLTFCCCCCIVSSTRFVSPISMPRPIIIRITKESCRFVCIHFSSKKKKMSDRFTSPHPSLQCYETRTNNKRYFVSGNCFVYGLQFFFFVSLESPSLMTLMQHEKYLCWHWGRHLSLIYILITGFGGHASLNTFDKGSRKEIASSKWLSE